MVLVEALILDRDGRALQVRRDLIERHWNALLLIDRERQRVVRVEHRGRLLHVPDLLDRLGVRQALRQPGESPDDEYYKECRGCDGAQRRVPDQLRMLASDAVPFRPELIDTPHVT